ETLKHRIRFSMSAEGADASRKSWYFSNAFYSVEYFKTFAIFEQLTSCTRRLLAGKMSIVCANLSNAYFSIANGANHIVYPDGTAPFEGMQHSFPLEYQAVSSFIDSVRKLHLDEREYVLLKALLMLSPSLDDASTSERALLTTQSECYAKALLSYVLARRGTQHGPRAYQEMLSTIDMLSHRVKIEK
ncbi:hypothetical protein PFISCL1PPCAC_13493, partial [Pristionchus fissidentatus]